MQRPAALLAATLLRQGRLQPQLCRAATAGLHQLHPSSGYSAFASLLEAGGSPLSRAAVSLALLSAAGGLVAFSSGYGSSAACAVAPAPAVSTSAPGLEPGTSGAPPDRYVIPAAAPGLPKEVILYQYEVCPFCCKLKAFLDYHKIPYRTVEVSPLTKQEIKWSSYKKVPVVLLDGEAFNDSSYTISHLQACLNAEKQAAAAASAKRSWFARSQPTPAPSTSASNPEEERWRRWVDDWFVRVITVNIYRNPRESFQTFDYITEHGNFSWLEREGARVVGATMMWGISGRLAKKYGISGDVREQLFAAANDWVEAVGDRQFMGGEQPGLADLAVFGVLRSVTGTHTFMDVMHTTPIGSWYERMMGEVGASSRLPSI